MVATMSVRLLTGDVSVVLPQLEPNSVQTCVTSPPYWRQRRYGASALEIGQEATPEEWIATMVCVFRDVRRALTVDGCLWLNVGDKYAAGGMGGGGMADARKNWRGTMGQTGWRKPPPGYKPKDLTLAPILLADALRRDGWYLRQVIVWEKINATEPPRLDRPSSSHEYLFLFSVNESSSARDPGEPWWHSSVWRIANDQDSCHVAKMPNELARRCIVASSSVGDTILDPFGGSGTVGMVADRNQRHAILVDLYAENVALSQDRLQRDAGPMFADSIVVAS
jgi:site-specific DNA-methyltransferase (cytosine-N4-specific)